MKEVNKEAKEKALEEIRYGLACIKVGIYDF